MSPVCLAGRRTGKWVALVNRRSSQSFSGFNQAISVFFYNREEGPLRMIEAIPLPHYGKWRHMPPREFECLSPSWRIAVVSFAEVSTLTNSSRSWIP